MNVSARGRVLCADFVGIRWDFEDGKRGHTRKEVECGGCENRNEYIDELVVLSGDRFQSCRSLSVARLITMGLLVAGTWFLVLFCCILNPLIHIHTFTTFAHNFGPRFRCENSNT